MKVRNIGSNMTEIVTDEVTILVSYSTPVACTMNGTCYKTEKKWSSTTTRHINKWFGGSNRGILKPQEFFDNLLEVPNHAD